MSMQLLTDLLALTKPKLMLLALLTALLGFWLGSMENFEVFVMAHLLIGAALTGASANALNQLFERDIDARMKRTSDRPLPSGRLSIKAVLTFGIATGIAAIAYLTATTNLLTAFLALLTIVSYAFIYTPLKRKTEFNTFVGAVPGALPILMGWAAGAGSLHAEAWLLFAILFVWQLPHFLAIAWVYKEDYIHSGLRIISLQDRSGVQTSWRIAFFTLILVFLSLLPVRWGMAGVLYFIAAGVLGGGLLVFSIHQIKVRLRHAKRFVSASILYLLLLVIFMIVDKL